MEIQHIPGQLPLLTYVDVRYSKTICPQPCALSNRSPLNRVSLESVVSRIAHCSNRSHQDIGRDDSHTTSTTSPPTTTNPGELPQRPGLAPLKLYRKQMHP